MKLRSLLLFTALLAVSACDKKSEGGDGDQPPKKMGAAPVAGAAAAMDAKGEAEKYFATVCAACHGTSGTGDGPGAANLNPKPRNYTDAAWQASVADADIAKIISEGGASVGKSAMMPANPGLKPDVLAALVKKIRAFAPATDAPVPLGGAAGATPAAGSAAPAPAAPGSAAATPAKTTPAPAPTK